METNWNKTGRLIFAFGILLWTTSYILKNYLQIPDSINSIFLYIGVVLEFIGFVIVAKNGGFKKRFCRK